MRIVTALTTFALVYAICVLLVAFFHEYGRKSWEVSENVVILIPKITNFFGMNKDYHCIFWYLVCNIVSFSMLLSCFHTSKELFNKIIITRSVYHKEVEHKILILIIKFALYHIISRVFLWILKVIKLSEKEVAKVYIDTDIASMVITIILAMYFIMCWIEGIEKSN